MRRLELRSVMADFLVTFAEGEFQWVELLVENLLQFSVVMNHWVDSNLQIMARPSPRIMVMKEGYAQPGFRGSACVVFRDV